MRNFFRWMSCGWWSYWNWGLPIASQDWFALGIYRPYRPNWFKFESHGRQQIRSMATEFLGLVAFGAFHWKVSGTDAWHSCHIPAGFEFEAPKVSPGWVWWLKCKCRCFSSITCRKTSKNKLLAHIYTYIYIYTYYSSAVIHINIYMIIRCSSGSSTSPCVEWSAICWPLAGGTLAAQCSCTSLKLFFCTHTTVTQS